MPALDAILTSLSIFFAALFGGYADVSSAPSTEPTHTGTSTTASVVSVLDGDTIIVDIEGKREFVRYIGIDTPEYDRETDTSECFADAATAANRELVADAEVTLVAGSENRDQYNRLLRYVYVDKIFVQQTLLEDGYARALPIAPNTQYAAAFENYESTAQQNGRGLWNACE